MDTTTNIRRKNLRFLVKKEGGITRLAEKLSKSKSHLSQLTSSGASRGMGARLAREIERRLNLGMGWMDISHNKGSNGILGKWDKLPDDIKSQIEGYIDWQLEIMEDEVNADADDEDTDFSAYGK
ncbi:MAG: hypothetical protein O7D86_04825 [Proteobacteria bacterium]|nr:hypothetical protein [Pseudomonadota bacterium]